MLHELRSGCRGHLFSSSSTRLTDEMDTSSPLNQMSSERVLSVPVDTHTRHLMKSFYIKTSSPWQKLTRLSELLMVNKAKLF